MRFTVLSLLTLPMLAACSDGTGPSGNDIGRVRLSITTGARPGAAPSLAAAETYTLGGTTLVLTRVQLVLKEIELKRAEESATCEDDSALGDSDDCEEFEVGPVLLDLPLNGTIAQVVAIDADTGTFRELEFEIHKPEDDGRDQAFLARYPDFRRVSIRVEGTWNGVPFVYTTDLSAEQELELVPPLQVTAAGSTEVTLRVDLRGWFLNAGATAFVNPATANQGQPAEGLVKENIKRSFEAYENDDDDD
jgi:hypothetical protein